MDQDAIQQLQELVAKQSQQAEALWKDISLLSSKGGNVLPHNCALLDPTTPLPTPDSDTSALKQGELHQYGAQGQL